jgi:hypothetical protein
MRNNEIVVFRIATGAIYILYLLGKYSLDRAEYFKTNNQPSSRLVLSCINERTGESRIK